MRFLLSPLDMTEEDRKDSQSFSVKDRRRFDKDGNERLEEGENMSNDSESKNNFIVKDSEDVKRTPQIDFSSFIMSLATQSLMQMGAMEPPQGVPLQVDMEGARQTIEVLALLKEKTINNLDEAEKKLMDKILHEIRLHFVHLSKKDSKES